jgi:D-glycero-D-manno-heptose 1,7-bisphosphate phosphatase
MDGDEDQRRSIRSAVFLDRDGTLIPDHGYLASVDGVTLLPGTGPALAALARAGFLLVLITNQSGIGRGRFSRAVVDAQHERLQELLRPFGVALAGVEVCPHPPEADCDCRKPRPGLLRRAAAALGIDLARSWMVGDKTGDIEAGRAAGCRTILLGTAVDPDTPADTTVPDLATAARWIVAHSEGS